MFPADQEILFPLGIELNLSIPGAKRILERCTKNQSHERYASICELGQVVRNSSVPLDQFPWPNLRTQILFFGERHSEADIKVFLTSNISRLQSIGINALALEMFNSRQQPALDAFAARILTRAQLKAELESAWGYESGPYLDLIEAARHANLRLIALDDRDTRVEGFFEKIQFRDRHMANILSGELKSSPSLRVAVLTGQLHAFRVFSKSDLTSSLPALLRHRGFSTISVFTFGARDPSGSNSVQKAIEGEAVATAIAYPSSYGYADFGLFLR